MNFSKPELIHKILDMYGITYKHLLPPTRGYRNESWPLRLESGKMLNLMLYKSESDALKKINLANDVASHLLPFMPVRTLYDKRIVQMRSGTYIKFAALQMYLPGNTIMWDAYTMEHIKLLGMAMANMHRQLSLHKRVNGSVDTHVELLQTLDKIEQYFSSAQVLQVVEGKLYISMYQLSCYIDIIKKVLISTGKLSGQHMLHMDFVRSNVLFSESPKLHISGIIDLEKTSYGHPSFDLARTTAFLIVDCKYKTEEQVRKYFIRSGYNKRGKQKIKSHYITLRNNRIYVLDILIDFFLLHDFYKFLRHNPYESLCMNEHYVRTRDKLTERGILGHIKAGRA